MNTKLNQVPKKGFINCIKKEKGITLVALIITIIILVLLAAIGIGVVYNSKIIEHAINGTQNYAIEGINENEVIEGTENILESAVNSIIGGSSSKPSSGESTKPEDKTPPQVKITKGEVTTNSIQIHVTATDSGSGLETPPKYTYYIKKSGETQYKKEAEKVIQTTYLYRNLEEGILYDVKVEVTDKAGNVGTGTIRMIRTDVSPAEYTVTYNHKENGGTSVTQETSKVIVNTGVDLGVTATKEGWEFIGWNTDKEATVGITALTMPERDITLYAIYRKTITVTYKKYNNEETTEKVTITNKQTEGSIILPNIENVIEGEETYIARGWSTSKEANASTTAIGTDVNVGTDMTYYANYTADTITTFYYNSNTSNGSFTPTPATATETKYMNYEGTKIEGNLEIPIEVKNSVGKYNTTYKGISNTVNSMETTTEIKQGRTYYAVYSKEVTITYPTSTTVATNKTTYRNEYFTSNTEMTTKLGENERATTDISFTQNITGYSLYGFAIGTSTNTRNYTTIANLRDSNTTIVYAIQYKSETINATFYYNNNTSSGGFTSANVGKGATRTTYVRCTTNTGAEMSVIEGSIAVPTQVTGSIGKYNTAYKGIANATGSMISVTANTAKTTYYAIYSTQVNIYYPQTAGTVKTRTAYRNEYLTNTTTMTTVIAVGNTSVAQLTNISNGYIETGYTVEGYYTVTGNQAAGGITEANLATNTVVAFYAKVKGSNKIGYCISNAASSWMNTGISAEDLEKDAMVGKYVDYKSTGTDYTVDKTYSGTGSNQTFATNNSMKWRIWGVEDNKLLLISETLAGNIQLQEHEGYNNGVKILNDACRTAYGNSSYGSAIEVRSINQDDIDKVTNMTTDAQRKVAFGNYGNAYTSNKDCPNIYVQQTTNKLDRSEQSVWYSGISSSGNSGKTTYYSYGITNNAIKTVYDALLTNPTANSTSGIDNHSAYWSASRCVIGSSFPSFQLFAISNGNVEANMLYGIDNGSFNSPISATRPMIEVDLTKIVIGATGSGTNTSPYSMALK